MARAEATSALTLARNAASPMADKLDKTISSAQKECSEGFRGAAQELVAAFGAPRTIYIVANGPEGQWYADSIANAPFLKSVFPAGVSIEAVTQSMLAPHIKNTGGTGAAAKSGDIFLALEAIFADARFDEHRALNFRTT